MNSAKRPSSKGSKGAVGIENFRDRIRLNLPRQWFDGQQKRVSLGLPFTDDNIKFAESLARQMELDWLGGHFDLTLEKYLPGRNKQQQNNVVDMPNKKPEMGLLELWDKWCECKKLSLKETTYKNDYCGRYRNFLNSAIESTGDNDAIAISNWLINNRDKAKAKNLLFQLSQAHDWGIKQSFVTVNPYEDLADRIKQIKVNKVNKRDDEGNIINEKDNENDRRAFSLDEAQAIIEAYETSKTVNHYAPLVKLLFYTGCRSGEAVALKWKHIKNDCTVISFQDSYERLTRHTGDTKTRVNRIFPVAVDSKLHQLLKELESKRLEPNNPNELVLRSKTVKQINWNAFTDTWRGRKDNGKRSIINDLIEQGRVKQYLKPYATRHTFITHQVNLGYLAHVIACWVGNSADVIWQHYFDNSHKDVIPGDF